MKASKIVVLCVAAGMGVLCAQGDRPVDRIEDLAPALPPQGAIAWPRLPTPPSSQPWVHSYEPNTASNPLIRELQRGSVYTPGPNWKPRPQWHIGVMLDGSRRPGGGIRVAGTMPNTPAAKAGLQQDDVLRALNDLQLRDYDMLRDLIQIIGNQEIRLTVDRGHHTIRVQLTPSKLDEVGRNFQPGIRIAPKAPQPAAPKQRAKPKTAATSGKVRTSVAKPGTNPWQQLPQDNKEVQKLLRELIGEVKKLQKD